MTDLHRSPRITAVALAAAACLLMACTQRGFDAAVSFGTQPIAFPGGPGSGQPRLTATVDGRPLMSWLEPDGDGYALKFAHYESGAWTDGVVVARGDDLFVNWADFPSIVPITESVWAAHWLRLIPDAFGAYNIVTSVSNDAGATWSGPEQLNDDDTHTEHGFGELFAWGDGIGAFWLDGRELAQWSFDDPTALLGTSLRFATIDRSGRIDSRTVVDEHVCDCCQPDFAATANGAVVAYRDRTADEIRDIVVSRYSDGAWQEPIAAGVDGWFIEGCPVNGPAIAARGEDVAVAWFTAADDETRVRFARSTDGGASFREPIDIDGRGAFGQVGLELRDDGSALAAWWRRAQAGGMDLVLRGIAPDGALSDIQIMAHSAMSQPVDVPQMMAVDDGLLFAWTTFDDRETVVNTFYVEN